MRNFLVFYSCVNHRIDLTLPVIRAVTATDPVNAIIAARQEERDLTGGNCAHCVLTAVKLAS